MASAKAYLEPSRTSIMELVRENSKRLIANPNPNPDGL